MSRKTFLGTLLADETGTPRPAAQRDDATTALTYALAGHPVWGVRVHTVRPSRDAIAVAERLQRSASARSGARASVFRQRTNDLAVSAVSLVAPSRPVVQTERSSTRRRVTGWRRRRL